MRPRFEKIPRPHNQSFFIRREHEPQLDMPYHYHPELELALTEGRTGKRFIGDRVERLESQDLVLIGKNLPHCFLGDQPVRKDSILVVIQFDMELFGENFTDLPETRHLGDLISRARQGVDIHGKTYQTVRKQLLELCEADPFERLILLLNILHTLAQTEEYSLITTQSFVKQYYDTQFESLTAVYNFIAQNFKGDITLSDAAKVANLSETYFCRFFKHHTLKTFKEVVIEMRISYACDLILKGKLASNSVSQIAYEAGFQNLSNFNRQFKRITGHTPTRYAKEVAGA